MSDQLVAADPTAPRMPASYPFTEEWLNPRVLAVLDGVVYLGKELESGLRVSAVAFGGEGAPRQVAELEDLPGNNLVELTGGLLLTLAAVEHLLQRCQQ